MELRSSPWCRWAAARPRPALQPQASRAFGKVTLNHERAKKKDKPRETKSKA